VNLIGEHTDYNGGFVLPLAIALRARVTLAARADDRVVAWSREFGGRDGAVEYGLGEEAPPAAGWIAFVQGATAVLRRAGHAIRGFDAAIESDVPPGGGLASSAALSVALLRGLRDLFGLAIEDLDLARLARAVEADFVGAPVGIMDQIAACFGDERHALLLDARAVEWTRVPIPDDAAIIVIDSGIRHRHAGGEYRARRAECQRAEDLLEVVQLRDVHDVSRLASLPAPLDRRARHVVTENGRVRLAADALRRGDLARAGALLDASHVSMRDDYEISTPEIDRLVELLRSQPGVHGARLTGGGFGGCVVALADTAAAGPAGRAACDDYVARTGRPGRVVLPNNPAGPFV
jgi:galactokinase